MIAKYAGKCDLTGTAILAGETEIEKFGPFTVLAGLGNQDAVNAYFANKIEEAAAILAETMQLRGREFDRNTNKFFQGFVEQVNARLSSKFFVLRGDAEWIRNEVAGMQRRLDDQRQHA